MTTFTFHNRTFDIATQGLTGQDRDAGIAAITDALLAQSPAQIEALHADIAAFQAEGDGTTPVALQALLDAGMEAATKTWQGCHGGSAAINVSV